jgi:hypothetical protein
MIPKILENIFKLLEKIWDLSELVKNLRWRDTMLKFRKLIG